ncbi:hypothetical protein D3C87_1897310 [compost metagenome]
MRLALWMGQNGLILLTWVYQCSHVTDLPDFLQGGLYLLETGVSIIRIMLLGLQVGKWQLKQSLDLVKKLRLLKDQ